MIIQAAVTCSDLKKIYAKIAKNHLQFLVMPTSTITDAMALKFLLDTMQLLKSKQCE